MPTTVAGTPNAGNTALIMNLGMYVPKTLTNLQDNEYSLCET